MLISFLVLLVITYLTPTSAATCLGGGAACKTAADCCSSGCSGGICSCIGSGAQCKVNGDCCSKSCLKGQCELVAIPPSCNNLCKECMYGMNKTLYHMTQDKWADMIIGGNCFKIPWNEGGLAGPGIYFAQDPKETCVKAEGGSGTFLQADVKLTATCVMSDADARRCLQGHSTNQILQWLASSKCTTKSSMCTSVYVPNMAKLHDPNTFTGPEYILYDYNVPAPGANRCSLQIFRIKKMSPQPTCPKRNFWKFKNSRRVVVA